MRTRRSRRVQASKDALQSKNVDVVMNIDGGEGHEVNGPADTGGNSAVAVLQRNKKIIFDADYDAAADVVDDEAENETNEGDNIINSDDDEDDSAPAEEVSGSSSRKLIMDQRAEERLASQRSSIYSSSLKRKRRKKRGGAHVDVDDDELNNSVDDDDEEEELFRSIDEERKSQAKEAKKLRRGKPFENNAHKPCGKHISFSSEIGLLEDEMMSKKISEHNLEVVVNIFFEKNQAHTLLGNKKPSATALLFAQRNGTIIDDKELQWRRTKSRKYYKVIGRAGW